MTTIKKKPVTTKKATTPVKTAVRPAPVAQLSTTAPSQVHIQSGLSTAAPLPTMATPVPNALSPGASLPPSAAVVEPKKTFAETGFGQFLSQNGGIAGIVGSIGSVVSTVTGNAGSTTTSSTTADDDSDGNGAPDDDNFTVLGLPPFAFAAVVLLLVVGLIVVLRKSKDG